VSAIKTGAGLILAGMVGLIAIGSISDPHYEYEPRPNPTEARAEVESIEEFMRSAEPCESEDQQVGPCYWNAKVRGNGQGRSFFVDADGNITYLEPR
jgi:hypothetical protein